MKPISKVKMSSGFCVLKTSRVSKTNSEIIKIIHFYSGTPMYGMLSIEDLVKSENYDDVEKELIMAKMN